MPGHLTHNGPAASKQADEAITQELLVRH